jgi:hypothetical protein
MGDKASEGAVFEVAAGPHDRRDAIVTVACPACEGECDCGCDCGCEQGSACTHELWELDAEGKDTRPVPCQCICEPGGCKLTWIVADLPAGQTRRYRLGSGEGVSAPGVEVKYAEGEQADFLLGGELFTSYLVRADVARPYCWPVLGPGGIKVTNCPTRDHPHHKSMYVAQGDVNGFDNWSEMEGHARTVNESVAIVTQGPIVGAIEATNDWVTPGGEKLLREITHVAVYNAGPDARIMDWTTTWRADYRGIHLGDTKEAGTLSVRVAESMEETYTGHIVNAHGAKGEEECWGKRSPWVDYWGTAEGEVLGLAIFDHPGNLRHPTYWHVRGYGLFTANVWGLHDYTGDWSKRGDFVLPQGSELVFNFRVYIHRGDTDEGKVAARYLDYAFPPKVKLVEG